MKTDNKLTVIVPVYNNEKYIAECLESIINQAVSDIDIIIVNDGSTDNSQGIIENYAKKDRRIIVINQTNSGKPSITRNRGLEIAQSEYICFLDSDDVYSRDKIKKCILFLDNYRDVDVVFHDFKFMTSYGLEDNVSYLKSKLFLERIKKYTLAQYDNAYLLSQDFFKFMSLELATFITSTIMIRSKSYKNIYFSEDMKIGEDLDLWFRLAHKRKTIFIDEVLSFYRNNDNSITKDKEGSLLGEIEAHIRNYPRIKDDLTFLEIVKYRKKIATLYNGLAYYYELNKNEKCLEMYKCAIKYLFNPISIYGLVKAIYEEITNNSYNSYL